MNKQKEGERAEAIQRLKKYLKPGTTVYTNLRHVSSSGMMRHIKVFIAVKQENHYTKKKEPAIYDITWLVGQLLDYRLADNGGLKVGGCGMDMGFYVVYSMGRAMFPKGFKLPKGKYGRNGDKSGYDEDGGYALEQTWI